jgi:hypothetical protein
MITGQTLTILVSKSIKDDLWNGMEIPHFVRNDKLNMRYIGAEVAIHRKF